MPLYTLVTLVTLDGGQSFDPDGDTITYDWSFASKPAYSQAALVNAAQAIPSFTPDVYGSYVLQLAVADPWAVSAADTVTVSFENVRPVANAGASQSATVGEAVTLDASASSDANGDTLTYRWSIAARPAASLAAVNQPSAQITSFVPDLAGSYVVELVVNDGQLASQPSSAQVQAVAEIDAVIEALRDAQDTVAGLGPQVFKNANMQKTLLNKLNAVIANVEAGNLAEALNQLENDLIGKTDGCAAATAPDKNDWLKTCAAQAPVYDAFLAVAAMIEELL